MNWRNVPPTVVPPGIRRASWTPPTIGTYFLRASDRSVWQVADVFRRDQQVKLVPVVGVKLVPAVGGTPSYVFAAELLRDFRQVAS
jgi:hypothetical protein